MNIAEVIEKVRAELPDWWWSVGDCSISADASIGPDRNGRDRHLLQVDPFDEGFHVDMKHPATIEEALLYVLEVAKDARAAYVGIPID